MVYFSVALSFHLFLFSSLSTVDAGPLYKHTVLDAGPFCRVRFLDGSFSFKFVFLLYILFSLFLHSLSSSSFCTSCFLLYHRFHLPHLYFLSFWLQFYQVHFIPTFSSHSSYYTFITLSASFLDLPHSFDSYFMLYIFCTSFSCTVFFLYLVLHRFRLPTLGLSSS